MIVWLNCSSLPIVELKGNKINVYLKCYPCKYGLDDLITVCVFVSTAEEWISTGLYLSPGMKTYIAMPEEIVNKGWKVLKTILSSTELIVFMLMPTPCIPLCPVATRPTLNISQLTFLEVIKHIPSRGISAPSSPQHLGGKFQGSLLQVCTVKCSCYSLVHLCNKNKNRTKPHKNTSFILESAFLKFDLGGM